MKEFFISHKFNEESLKVVNTANAILSEYQELGYRLSLRQLYYQLVARDFVENSIKSYKRVGTLLSDARLAGLVDWNMIEDRGREAVIPAAWSSPGQIVKAAANQFRVDRWEGQEAYVEVMVEKDALSGILEPECQDLHVHFTANKGYSSSSAMYEASKRILSAYEDDKQVHLLYFGDHDPSGIDMTRDISSRLDLFTQGAITKNNIHRLALNWDQVETWKPPKNPAKETDSRFEVYLHEFGESSWELDAVEPRVLAALVRDTITNLIDPEAWEVTQAKELRMKTELLKFAANYDKPKKSK